jgi:carbon-monoxide dehydrogenase large subunit
MVHLAFVRSPYAHARITSIDTSAAKAAKGVLAVYTGADLNPVTGPVPCAVPLPELKMPAHHPLAQDKVRHVGEAVAVVVARDRYLAADAAELVEVEYEQLPAVTDAEAALADGAPILHDDAGTNLAIGPIPLGNGLDAETMSYPGVTAAFDSAEVKISQRMHNQRLIPSAMEPRGVVASYNAGEQMLTLWSSTQIPHILRLLLQGPTDLPEHHIRVIAPEVGGGFGAKLNMYAEEMLVAVLSKKLERPVKWIESRREAMAATIHGRDLTAYVELAATREGKLTAARVKLYANIGAYHQLLTPAIPTLTATMASNVYDIPLMQFEIYEVFTNKTPVDAYRGAGRPEGIYFVERAMDILADELGMDPAELRRKNFITKDRFPFPTATGAVYDSGDYEAALDKALANIDYPGLLEQQRQARAEGRLFGVGFSTYAEVCGMGPSAGLPAGGWENSEVRVDRSGKVTVLTGISPHGQGQETTFAQMTADALGVDLEDVTVLHGDTAIVASGVGTFGSRGQAVGGAALHMSLQKIRAKAAKFAAQMMDASEEDLEFEGGRLYVRGSPDKGVTFAEVAGYAHAPINGLPEGMEPGLQESSFFEPTNFTFPFGTHISVVEIDRDTGEIELKRMVAVDDCGTVINPMIVEGQIHGGLAQGIGQAIIEEAVYDDEGQLLTGTFMDYAMPRATHFPMFELDHTVTPTPVNPLGAKGIGEAGTIGSTPCIVNAVVDALSPLGVRHVDMMLRPEKIWRLIQDANGGGQ